MASVTRIKPTNQGKARISLDVTYNQVLAASYFKPDIMNNRDEDGDLEFEVSFTHPEKSPDIGRYGAAIPKHHTDEKVQLIVNLDTRTTEEEQVALLVNVKNQLATFEKAVNAATKALSEAKEQIKEV